MLISNVAIPLEVEKDLITEARNQEKILPFLIDSAKQLERAGVDFIVIPCNTVHIFIEEIRKAVNIPVLSIIEETAFFLLEAKINEIEILTTTATIRNKLFDEDLEKLDISIKTPDNPDQLKIGKIIHRLVDNKSNDRDKQKFLKIINKLKTQNILLACTDLQLLNIKSDKIRIFDTMEILAQATIKRIVK